MPDERATLERLVAGADVFSENFKAGTMASLGLGAEALQRLNPRLVHVSHKGFLPGPYESRLALDEVVQNMAGLTYMTGPKGRPLRAGSSVNDIMGGMFGAIGVLGALAGAVCPVCVVATPALVGAGLARLGAIVGAGLGAMLGGHAGLTVALASSAPASPPPRGRRRRARAKGGKCVVS